ncbi:hypothetical protein JCM16303_007036 [Sporobolomyces ruberrimus]
MASSGLTSRSTRKRELATESPQEEEELDVDSPVAKKRAPRTTASEKAAKKSARMERNRIAAQASRDRKKNHTDFLEGRIAELEAQLQQTTSTPSSSNFGLSLPSLLPSPPTHFVNLERTKDDREVARLREENESLRTQLELEKLESKGLQLRLSSLEGKFGRLEKLLEKLGNRDQVTRVEPESHPAADVVFASFSPPPSTSHLGDNNLNDNNLAFDFPLFDVTSSTEFAPNPLFDSTTTSSSDTTAFSFDAPLIDDSTLNQAWSDWSTTVALPQQSSSFVEPEEESAATSFDLFEFLRQEVAAGGHQQQPIQGFEVVC